MRVLVAIHAVAVVVHAVAACGGYDPLDDVRHREYADTPAALQAILDEVGPVRVYAVGEYHPTEDVRRTPLARFTAEVLPVLQPHAQHLVLEAWFDASCAGGGDTVQAQIQAATQRPPQQHADLGRLAAGTMPTHGLPMTCIEHSSVLDPGGRVDFLRLLAMVTEKLFETAHRIVEHGDRSVIVYGGALHNDLYPRWLLDDLAYGHRLAREVPVVEIDLVVPEVVWPVKLLWGEPWFPLLGKSTPGRTLVWERGPGSYVVILPAETDAIAEAGRAANVM